jgi:hypothetical protein
VNRAACQAGSSVAVSSIQPRSPPADFDGSVETLLATSSKDLPALIWARASSAFFFASAFWASVGTAAPVSTVGSTASSQM